MNQWKLKQRKRLIDAMYEENRFIGKAQAAADEIEAEDEYTNKQFAAAKRASMDLTRALADLRRSPYRD